MLELYKILSFYGPTKSYRVLFGGTTELTRIKPALICIHADFPGGAEKVDALGGHGEYRLDREGNGSSHVEPIAQ